jgi:hypothetical protein
MDVPDKQQLCGPVRESVHDLVEVLVSIIDWLFLMFWSTLTPIFPSTIYHTNACTAPLQSHGHISSGPYPQTWHSTRILAGT